MLMAAIATMMTATMYSGGTVSPELLALVRPEQRCSFTPRLRIERLPLSPALFSKLRGLMFEKSGSRVRPASPLVNSTVLYLGRVGTPQDGMPFAWEVVATPHSSGAGMRPNGLTEVTLLLGARYLAGFLFVQNYGIASITFAAAVNYVVLWYFWEGRNWARWLVLLTSVLTVFNLSMLPRFTPLQGAVLVMETMLGLFLIYWLNTRAVRHYFTSGGAAMSL